MSGIVEGGWTSGRALKQFVILQTNEDSREGDDSLSRPPGPLDITVKLTIRRQNKTFTTVALRAQNRKLI